MEMNALPGKTVPASGWQSNNMLDAGELQWGAGSAHSPPASLSGAADAPPAALHHAARQQQLWEAAQQRQPARSHVWGCRVVCG